MKQTLSNVETRGGFNYPSRYPLPCINVKDKTGYITPQIMERFKCNESVAQQAIEWAAEMSAESFWSYWQDETGDFENGLYSSPECAYFPGETVTIHAGGRSGGWLCVEGLPDVDDWDDAMHDRWLNFMESVQNDVKYRCSLESYIEAIEANRWAEPYSERYNFSDTPDGVVCLADKVTCPCCGSIVHKTTIKP